MVEGTVDVCVGTWMYAGVLGAYNDRHQCVRVEIRIEKKMFISFSCCENTATMKDRPLSQRNDIGDDDLGHTDDTAASDASKAAEDDELDDGAREACGEAAEHEDPHRETERRLSAEDVAKAPV